MLARFLLIGLCYLLGAGAARGADDEAAPATGTPVAVTANGETLFYLRTPGIWKSVEERGAQVNRRVREVLHSRTLRQTQVAISEDEAGTTTLVRVGAFTVVSVTDSDARMENRDRHVLAQFYAEQLQQAVVDYEAAFSGRQLTLDVVLLVFATAAFIGLLKLLAMLFPRLYRRIDTTVSVSSIWGVLPTPSRTRLMKQVLRGLARETRLLLTLVLCYFYLAACVRLVPWTKEYYYQLSDYVLAPVVASVVAVWHYLPNLAVLLLIILFTRYVLKLLRLIFDALSQRADVPGGFHPEWAKPTLKIVRAAVIALALVMAFPYLPGAQSPAFKGVSIFIGILISLGSTSAVANLAAGVILIYSRSFRVGDWVRIGNSLGEVVEATLLVTRIRTGKNVRVTFPNSAVMGQSIENFSVPGQNRAVILHTSVTIGYDAPWRQVEELLLKAARVTDGVLAAPSPFVLQTKLDDFYVCHELNVFTATPHLTGPLLSALHRNILDTFNAAGVEIMSPHYEARRDGSPSTIPAVYPGAGTGTGAGLRQDGVPATAAATAGTGADERQRQDARG